jgi:hypothetical protein
MNTLEKSLWKLLKGHLPKGCDYQRIETGGVGLGVPDVNVCLDGVETWLELKVVKGKRVELDSAQSTWHWRRVRAGGRVWILARDRYDLVRKGKMDRLYLWRGEDSHKVRDGGVEYPAFMTWDAPFPWSGIIPVLLGP